MSYICEGFEIGRFKNCITQRLPDLLGYGAGATMGHEQLPGREQLPGTVLYCAVMCCTVLPGGQPHQPQPPPPPQHPHRAHV